MQLSYPSSYYEGERPGYFPRKQKENGTIELSSCRVPHLLIAYTGSVHVPSNLKP